MPQPRRPYVYTVRLNGEELEQLDRIADRVKRKPVRGIDYPSAFRLAIAITSELLESELKQTTTVREFARTLLTVFGLETRDDGEKET